MSTEKTKLDNLIRLEVGRDITSADQLVKEAKKYNKDGKGFYVAFVKPRPDYANEVARACVALACQVREE